MNVLIELFDRVQLRSGKSAHIVEIYEQGVAYEADIADDDGEYSTDSIRHSDILYVFADKGDHPFPVKISSTSPVFGSIRTK